MLKFTGERPTRRVENMSINVALHGGRRRDSTARINRLDGLQIGNSRRQLTDEKLPCYPLP